MRSANDREMWDEMQNDWEEFAVESDLAIREIVVPTKQLGDVIQDDIIDDRVGEDRAVQSTVRVGQDFFRAAVLSAYNEQCCITGLSVPRLLVASHIIPWRVDKRNRVNPRNGLLLSALHDKAFDIGLITIDDDMTVTGVPEISGAKRSGSFRRPSRNTMDNPFDLPTKFRPAKRIPLHIIENMSFKNDRRRNARPPHSYA